LQDLVEKWWYLNISRTSECPLHVVNDYKEPEDLLKLGNVVGTLVNAGAGSRIPSKWINEKFDIPEPEKGEETLEQSQPFM
jgi:phage gp29-like protein